MTNRLTLGVIGLMISAFAVFAGVSGPQLVPDYDRDGKIEGSDYASLAAIEPQRVIIDTDLGSSMDDLFAIDIAARMHMAGKLDLLGVMIDRPDCSAEGGKGEFLKFADRYLGSLGLGKLPLGKSMPLAEDRIPQHVFNPYWTLIYSNNVTGVGQMLPTNRTDAQLAAITNAVVLYRRLLYAAPDKSVVICSTGFLNNLKALMEAPSNYEKDGIAATGLELIAAKVRELRIMAGCFDSSTAPDGTDGAEYNAAGDPAGTKKVFEEWPSPVVVSTWEVGLKLYYKTQDVLADFPVGTLDPVVRAAYTYWPDPGPDAMNRLWDVMTLLPLVEGETLAPLSERGGIAVDEKGVTTFTPNASSNRCYQVASNMNASAVMERVRMLCRGGRAFNSGMKTLAPYLHEVWYDSYMESDLTGEDAPFGDLPLEGMGGCSSVRVGNFHGRNLDIAVSDLATVVIHMAAGEGRFASIGTTQWFEVSETALTNGTVSAHRFDVLPNWMLDGINENGVAINVNIIPMDVPQDGDDPDSDERPTMHARKVVRYVLDHAESAAGVIEELKGFRIFGNIGAVENNIHWMISDAEQTFVVEIIQGEVVAREHPIMTNFNLNWDNERQSKITDPENWGPERYFWAAAYSNDTDTIFKTYSLHAEGIERYIRLRDNGGGYLSRGSTFAGMFDLMRETQYSKIAYLPLADTYLSDLLDMQEVKDAGFKSLADIYAASNAVKLAETWEWLRPKMANVYENLADYRNPEAFVPYSITTHNVTFDLEKKMFRIAVQEDYDQTFDFCLVEPIPVTPGVPLVCDTAEEATNEAKQAVLKPSEEVAKVLTTAELRNRYVDSFGFVVNPTEGGKFAVEAELTAAAQSNLVENAAELTREIALTNIVALVGEATTNLTLAGGVSGFYYSLYDGTTVTNLTTDANEKNLNVLCGADKTVVFPEVKKPSEAAGFFSIGIHATPKVD